MDIPDKVKDLFDRTKLVALGTADKNGVPNVVPVHWKTITGKDRILVINNYMKATKENILSNSKICISFWDPVTEEAYKIKGDAIHHTSGPMYEEGKKFIQEKKPGRIPKGVIEVRVKEIFVITPGPDAGNNLIS